MEYHRIIELLGSVSRRLARRLAPVVEAENLSITDVLVLWKINRKQVCRVTEIAEEIGVSPSTLTGVLDRLVAAGWLIRESDPVDRRAVLVRATESVGPLIRRLLDRSDDALALLLRPLSEKRLTRLTGDLESLIECLDEAAHSAEEER